LSLANAGILTAQSSRKPVQVYADENALPSLLPEQNEEYSSIPLPEVIDRENQLQPGRWNDNKVSTMAVLLLIIQCICGFTCLHSVLAST